MLLSVFVYCLRAYAYHFFSPSDRNKAWPGGNCQYLLFFFLTPRTLLPSTCETQNIPLISLRGLRCRTSSQSAWDVTPFPPFYKPFLLSQYWDIKTKRKYWELSLIAFRS